MLGLLLCHGLLSSNNLHICNNSRSLNFGAAICNPTGKPSFKNRHGSVAEGILTGKVGETFSAGRMGDYTVEVEGEITFGNIFRFDASNIDEGAELF